MDARIYIAAAFFVGAPLFWGYENYRLIERIDAAFERGEREYTEIIDSRLCIGIRWGYFETELPSEFNIYDRHGAVFNERFQKSTIGGCARHKPYRATWTKLDG